MELVFFFVGLFFCFLAVLCFALGRAAALGDRLVERAYQDDGDWQWPERDEDRPA